MPKNNITALRIDSAEHLRNQLFDQALNSNNQALTNLSAQGISTNEVTQ